MEAGRIGKFGGWELDLITDKGTSSKAIYDIHELPYDFDPSYYDTTSFYPAPHYDMIISAIAECRKTGSGYDLELKIITANKNKIWVRTYGEPL